MGGMLQFLGLYGGDILIGLLILFGVISVVRDMIRNKKAGKSVCGGCDGDCAHCMSRHTD